MPSPQPAQQQSNGAAVRYRALEYTPPELRKPLKPRGIYPVSIRKVLLDDAARNITHPELKLYLPTSTYREPRAVSRLARSSLQEKERRCSS